MNTCGTCKHFGPLVTDLTDYSGDEDVAPIHHECLLLKHLNGSRPYMRDAPAGVIDGSGYYAAFCVHEDFGCNQWELRATDQSSGSDT